MTVANGIPLIGKKDFLYPAADVTVVDRGLYDLVHWLVSIQVAQGGGACGPWGEPVHVRRRAGAGLVVTTTYVPPEALAEDDDETPAPANG